MIRFLKIWDVKSPERGTKVASWIDWFIPLDFKPTKMNIWDSIVIKSWIKCIIAENYEMVFYNKSWVAIKKWLIIGAQVIDSDFRWEFSFHLTKISWDEIELNPWDKIVQGIIRKIELNIPEEITEEEFNSIVNNEKTNERWEWKFGSTGTR